MQLLSQIFLALQALSALVLVVLVLLHSPKGDGIGGLGGAAQLFSSQGSAEASLTRLTYYVVGTFYVSSFILGHYLHP